jgi:hypothetical protein
VAIDHSKVRLGKKNVRIDVRTKRMARYLTGVLPPFPAEIVPPSITSTMLLNDQYGDCTIASALHFVQVWTKANGAEVVPTDADALAGYEAACGFNPADPNTDQGGVELDVLNYWRASGLGGHKIAAFVALDPLNWDHVRASCFLFGGCYIGVSLPDSCKGKDVWRLDMSGASGDPTPGSYGGHAVPIVGYSAEGPIVITWGEPLQMSWDFHDAYVDESYAPLSTDWAPGGKPAPSGFNLAALQADLGLVGGA